MKTEPVLKVRQGPRRPAQCVINGCPIDEHSFVVTLPRGHGVACTSCADERGWKLDWSNA